MNLRTTAIIMLFFIAGVCAWMGGWTTARNHYRNVSPTTAAAAAPAIQEDSEQSFREGVMRGASIERESPNRYTLDNIYDIANSQSTKENYRHAGNSDGFRRETIPLVIDDVAVVPPDYQAQWVAQHQATLDALTRDLGVVNQSHLDLVAATKGLVCNAFNEGAVRGAGIERIKPNYYKLSAVAVVAYRSSETKKWADQQP